MRRSPGKRRGVGEIARKIAPQGPVPSRGVGWLDLRPRTGPIQGGPAYRRLRRQPGGDGTTLVDRRFTPRHHYVVRSHEGAALPEVARLRPRGCGALLRPAVTRGPADRVSKGRNALAPPLGALPGLVAGAERGAGPGRVTRPGIT